MHVIAYFCFNHSKTLIKRLRSSIKFIYRPNFMAELVYLLILTLQHSHAKAGQAATGAEGARDFEKKKFINIIFLLVINPFFFFSFFFSYRVPKCFFHVVPPRKNFWFHDCAMEISILKFLYLFIFFPVALMRNFESPP